MTGTHRQQKKNSKKWPHKFPAFLAAALAFFLLSSGCTQKSDSNLPFYDFQDTDGVLIVNHDRYLEDTDTMGSLGNEGRWVFTGEVGNAIGVCGGKEENGGQFTVYEVKGDVDHDLICARPNRFTNGPYREFLGFREGVSLKSPTPETISRIVMTYYNEDSELLELGKTEDTKLVKALLELYVSLTPTPTPTRPDGTYEERALNLYHSKYPTLYFYLRCTYHAESGTAYLKCADGLYRPLPPELTAALTPSQYKPQ